MKVTVSGKNMNVGESLRQYAEDELQIKVTKYFERAIEAHIVFHKESHLFCTDITVNEGTGNQSIIKGQGKADDVYAAFDQAADRIEKQLRRYKRKLKNHNGNAKEELIEATKYVLSNDGQEVSDEEDNPLIIAEKHMTIESLTVSDAVMRMDLAGLPALMFVNKKTNKLNLVYHRVDGNITWVETDIATVSRASNAA